MGMGGCFRQTAELEFLVFIDNFENKSAASTTRGNFDEFKIGRAA
jgi:hypothetical protein